MPPSQGTPADIGSLLSYGALGLGLALALLAFWLLSAEQKAAVPRKSIISAIYVFMGFALALTLMGGGLEVYKFANTHADERRLADAVAALKEAKQQALALRTETDSLWWDALRGNRRAVCGPESESMRVQVFDDSQEGSLKVQLKPSMADSPQCKYFLAMGRPPAQVKIDDLLEKHATLEILRDQGYLVTGKLCSEIDQKVELKFSLVKGGPTPLAVETYEVRRTPAGNAPDC